MRNTLRILSRMRRHMQKLPRDLFLLRLLKVLQLQIHYQTRQRGRGNVDQHITLAEFELVVFPGVFNPIWYQVTAEFTAVLTTLPLPSGTEVLELCTGCGVGALALARRGNFVIATDISAEAVRCAAANARRNGLDHRIEVVCGDLYEPIGTRRFDLIVANPPFFDGSPDRGLAFYGGEGGALLRRLMHEAPDHLQLGGRLVLSYSSLAPPGRIESWCAEAGLTILTVHLMDLLSEVVLHYVIGRTPH